MLVGRVFAWGGSEGEKVGEDLRPGMDVKCAKVNGIITNTTLRMRMRKSQHHLRNVLVFFYFICKYTIYVGEKLQVV